MSRKKNGSSDQPTESPSETISDTNGNSEKRRPVQSFKCYSDGTTCLEVAVWGKEVEHANGNFVQYSLTVSRTWRDSQNVWHDSGKDDNGNARLISFRAHDIPVLNHLLNKAHAWMIDQRVMQPS